MCRQLSGNYVSFHEKRDFYKPDEPEYVDIDTEDEIFDEIRFVEEIGNDMASEAEEGEFDAVIADTTDSDFELSSCESDEEIEDDQDEADSEVDQDEEKPATKTAQETNDQDVDEDYAIVQRIISELKMPRNHPKEIKTEDFVTDLSFHPISDHLAVALITGDVLFYKYSLEENQLVNTFELHMKACRDVEFSEDGDVLYTTSKDKSIMITDVNTGKLRRFYDEAHETAIYCVRPINENLIATGDDDGYLKVWDLRTAEKVPLFSLHEVDDYISCIHSNDSKKIILMTSGDGYLTSINLGARKMYVQSEQYEEELTCMGLYRNDSKLVVGTSKGRMYSFNWGEFGYHCDVFNGPKTSTNAMLPITQRMGVLGCEDGLLRAVNTVPGRSLGVVGQHNLAVETMDISNTGEFIASSSHDNDIRFWNIKYFEDFDDDMPAKDSRYNLPSSKYTNARDFFSGLVD
ncbi:WD repeat-containing protein 55 homolog [Sergentomyia squamirostris]